MDEIIRCMSVAILYHIKPTIDAAKNAKLEIFSEEAHPLTKDGSISLDKIPDVIAIFKFINMIFRVQKLPPECAILCVAYIERVILLGGVVVHPSNWRRLLFAAAIIASKVWEDESVWNVDFINLFPRLSLEELNKLESHFVELLQFNVSVTGSQYAEYYFELRSLSELDSNHFPLEPLDKQGAAKLEERSLKTEKAAKNPKRSKSVDDFGPKSPRAILTQ